MGNEKIKCEHEQALFADQRCLENSRENDELEDFWDQNSFSPKDTS